MTPTSKKVSRVTMDAFASRIIGHKARRIVVTITGDTLILRLHGTQQREYFAIKDAFETARWKRVRSEMCQKINARRRAR